MRKSGSFFSYGEERLGQGRNNAKGYLREHPEVFAEIERKVYEATGAEPPVAVVALPDQGEAPAAPADAPEEARGGRRAGRLMTRVDSERAVALAWKAVGTRERTEHELRTYLEGKKIEPAAIEEAVAELAEAGFVDDAVYARRFAEDRRAVQSWGRERIERDLLRRGVERGLIERALAAGRGSRRARRRAGRARRAVCGGPRGRPRAKPGLAAAGPPWLQPGPGLRGGPPPRAAARRVTTLEACAPRQPGLPSEGSAAALAAVTRFPCKWLHSAT